MKRSAIALMSVCASLLMVQTAAAQSVPRQAPAQQVAGDRVVAPPTVPSINVAPFTVPQRTSVARQLTGSSTLTAGATQRFGHGSPTPNGGELALWDPWVVYGANGVAIFPSAATNGGVVARVTIRPVQESGLLLFECPISGGSGLTWRTRVGTSALFTEGVAPVANSRALFVVDMTGLQDKKVEITALPRGAAFGFTYCDVTALSG
jgi:hypothetical protein